MDRTDILFNELPHSKPIRKFVRANLAAWCERKNISAARLQKARVEFFRAPFDGKVGCYVEVQAGANLWRSFEYGKGIQAAFHTCLKHLSENTILERSA